MKQLQNHPPTLPVGQEQDVELVLDGTDAVDLAGDDLAWTSDPSDALSFDGAATIIKAVPAPVGASTILTVKVKALKAYPAVKIRVFDATTVVDVAEETIETTAAVAAPAPAAAVPAAAPAAAPAATPPTTPRPWQADVAIALFSNFWLVGWAATGGLVLFTLWWIGSGSFAPEPVPVKATPTTQITPLPAELIDRMNPKPPEPAKATTDGNSRTLVVRPGGFWNTNTVVVVEPGDGAPVTAVAGSIDATAKGRGGKTHVEGSAAIIAVGDGASTLLERISTPSSSAPRKKIPCDEPIPDTIVPGQWP